MEAEKLEIRHYLQECPPLPSLPNDELDQLASQITLIKQKAHTDVMQVGDNNDKVLLIRHGAVEVHLESGELYGRFGDGDWVGYRSVTRGGKVSMNVRTLEDTLFYAVPDTVFLQLLAQYEVVAHYFSKRKPERLRQAIKDIRTTDNHSMITLHVRDLMKLPMLIGKQDSIQQVAQQMGDFNTQAALVVAEDGHLCGLVTDVDFRKRVVAAGLPVNHPVAEIMTPHPLTLSPRDQASEALLLMARRNIRHVPVVENNEVVGIITANDLLSSQSSNAVYLVGDIFAANHAEQLATISQGLPQVLVGLVKQSLPAYDIGHAITSIGQAITRRLLILAEDKFGQPPIPYAFIVAGSMARREQTAHSDQDNGMILSDEYNEAEHGDYFRNVAKYVSDGLDACGYIYCPGNIMATNDQWRQPLSIWRSYFSKWIDTPQPQALLYASIFFDLRCLHGDESLLQNLQTEILSKTKTNTMFQAYMASNALSFKPPLGFFRGFVLDKEKGSDSEKGMDMKKRGVVPIIDMARVYALAAGLAPINTWERLDALAANETLTQASVDDLRDAFEFISMVRLQHQADQIKKGQKPNNYVPPEQLSALERRHLKDAFEVVSTLQESMANRFHASRLR